VILSTGLKKTPKTELDHGFYFLKKEIAPEPILNSTKEKIWPLKKEKLVKQLRRKLQRRRLLKRKRKNRAISLSISGNRQKGPRHAALFAS
jgi:hypothetical protein